MVAVHSSSIVKELVASGIIPPACFRWSLISEAGGVIKIVSEVFITEQQFRDVADALMRNREEAREAAALIVYSNLRDKKDGIVI